MSDSKQDVTLPPPGSPSSFVDQFGGRGRSCRRRSRSRPTTDRLVAYDAWPGPDARVGLTLIDPTGAYAAYTRPQGNGDHGQVDVRKPVAGTWTAIVFLRDGTFTGAVHLEFATQRFTRRGQRVAVQPDRCGRARPAASTTTPRCRRPPATAPTTWSSPTAPATSTVVPVVLRSLVPINAHGGSFDGTLFGGNGRQFVAQTDTFAFDVPKDRKALCVALAFPDNAEHRG